MRLKAAGLWVALLAVGGARAELPARGDISWPDPAGLGLLVVTAPPFSADPTGQRDSTAALQAAIVEARRAPNLASETHAIIYLPNGTYLISDRLLGEVETPGPGWIRIQGESRDGTVLQLKDRCDGTPYTDASGQLVSSTGNFAAPGSPLGVVSFFEGEWTNNAFTNGIENLTIDVGSDNPGAIALRMMANNCGYVRNVRLRSSDPERRGAVGLDLRPRVSGPGLVKGLLVEGFDVGIQYASQDGTYSWSVEDVELVGQRVLGLEAAWKPVTMRHLRSVNVVPAVRMRRRDGMLVLLDSQLETPGGVAVDAPAIIDDEGVPMHLRGVEVRGYRAAIEGFVGSVATTSLSGVFVSGAVNELFPSGGLPEGLAAEDTPEVPLGDPARVLVIRPEAGNDTERFRQAMASGAETIVLASGIYQLSGTIDLGPSVRRVVGNFAEIRLIGTFPSLNEPVFRLSVSRHPAVQIERIYGSFAQTHRPYFAHHASASDLVLRDIFWASGPLYRNDPHRGRLFLENVSTTPGGSSIYVAGTPSLDVRHQTVFARQLNPENYLPHLVVRGGNFWSLAFKMGEQQGPLLTAYDHANVDLLGGFMNASEPNAPEHPEETRILINVDSNVTATFLERADEVAPATSWGHHAIVVDETRNGVNRQLLYDNAAVRKRLQLARAGLLGGAVVPLYTGRFLAGNGNEAPSVSASAPTLVRAGEPVVLGGLVQDPDGSPAAVPVAHWRQVDGPGIVRFALASAAENTAVFAAPGTYRIRLTASDGATTASADRWVAVLPTNAAQVENFAFRARLRDLPPRDGVGDIVNYSTTQRCGDERSALTPGLDIESRYYLQFDLQGWGTDPEAIEEVHLGLVPLQLRSPLDLILEGVSEGVWGVVDAADYSSAGTTIGTLTAAEWEPNQPRLVKVTAWVQAAMAAGDRYVAFRMRPAGGPNDSGTDNYVEFHGEASPAELRPALIPTASSLLPPSRFGWWAHALAGNEGSVESLLQPDADPDFDGVANLIEYALGRNPGVPDRADPLVEVAHHSGGARISLVRPAGPGLRRDVRIGLEQRSSGGVWQLVDLDPVVEVVTPDTERVSWDLPDTGETTLWRLRLELDLESR